LSLLLLAVFNSIRYSVQIMPRASVNRAEFPANSPFLPDLFSSQMSLVFVVE
jgi:hypothetical protein